MTTDWRDGFLFVGNQLSLDFLNTRPVVDGSPVELLPDAASLLRWLEAAGLLDRHQARELSESWPAHADLGLKKLLEFRETLRRVVFRLEAGAPPPPSFIDKLNRLLLQYPSVDQVVKSPSGPRRGRRFDLRRPEDAFSPLIDGTVNLLTTVDPSKVRKCASCVLHFQDTSKKGTRRWCSMEICGNRAKVATYAQRKRAEVESGSEA